MPRLTGNSVKQLADDRLSQKSELQRDIRKLLDLTTNRAFFDTPNSETVGDSLLAACTDAVSSGKRVLATESLVNARQLPEYESFCLLIYVSITLPFYETLAEMVAAAAHKRMPKSDKPLADA
jgi:hypothetical protein